MRSVMWHKDQESVCALVLAIVNEAQTSLISDRFVLIGLCWLYGRSEFPPFQEPENATLQACTIIHDRRFTYESRSSRTGMCAIACGPVLVCISSRQAASRYSPQVNHSQKALSDY